MHSIVVCFAMMYVSLVSLQYIDGLAQDCSNSSGLAMELLQSCTKPSICLYSYCSVNDFMSIRS